jgi:hypothetical protein
MASNIDACVAATYRCTRYFRARKAVLAFGKYALAPEPAKH